MTFRFHLQPLATPFLWLHHRLVPRDSAVGAAAYLWLVWLGFFFIPWGLQKTPLSDKIATLVAVALFLPLYFRCYWTRGTERSLIIGIIAVLGLVLIPYNASGGGLLIYSAAFAAYSFRARVTIPILAVLAIAGSLEYVLLGFPFNQWIWIPILVVMIGLANLLGAEHYRQHYALQKSQDEVKRLAATAERERIGRDLHDLLGHTLTLITVKAELAARMAERDMPGAAREIREVEQISREALQQVREAVGGYRSHSLSVELTNARSALTSANVEVEENIAPPRLSKSQESLLAMVLREAVTNVIRHAHARHCRIELNTGNETICLQVSDDGHGGKVNEGNGLKGMRERLHKVAGRLDITSDKKGTCLSISLPLQNHETAPAAPSPIRGETA